MVKSPTMTFRLKKYFLLTFKMMKIFVDLNEKSFTNT